MKIFDPTESAHFCAGFKRNAGPAELSLEDFVATQLGARRTLQEGSPEFAAYRDCSLREAERRLFLAISHYRRSLNLMIPSSAAWAQVTIYYGAFFAASALLPMFGGWIAKEMRTVIEVAQGTAGTQELVLNRKAVSPSNRQGSHQRFWDFWYSATQSLLPWVDPALRIGIEPVSNNPTWMIEERNAVNYDGYNAWRLMGDFQRGFANSQFPGSLPGTLQTQFVVFEAQLQVVCAFARANGLRTDVLGSLRPQAKRREVIRELIYNQECPSSLQRKAKRRGIIV